MSMLLAPYNDSMRLGMGFNSYTQSLCIDGAVKVDETKTVNVENPSQVVTYSSKFVERLSEIVSGMNISYSAAIKKGTIEVAGNGNSIDDDKIKASDLNLVVSVQVVNQTTCLEDSPKFKYFEGDRDDIAPGSTAFNEAFGDCYISGFVEGGDFTSIISIRCLDRAKASSVVQSIKGLAKTSVPKDFSMDSYSLSTSLSSSEALKDTETTITVSWMGGGQIKPPEAMWDIDSVYTAAAAFPSNVAKTPQRTWAILTKYKANRSFTEWALAKSLRPLEYDAVTAYTAELFNNFMEYKQLIKQMQNIIAHRKDFEPTQKTNAITTNIKTLVAVRAALRREMNKIVAVVNKLSRRPHALQEASNLDDAPNDEIVRAILDANSGGDTRPSVPKHTRESTVSSDADDQFQAVTHAEATTQLSTPPPNADPPGDRLNLSALIAPEIWADLLPIRIASTEVQDPNAPVQVMFPPPPMDDTSAPGEPRHLQILAAVCGLHDVTEILNNMVHESTLSVRVNEIDGLVRDPIYADIPKPFVKNLSFVYQVGSGPMRFCSVSHDEKSSETLRVNFSSEHPIVTARNWNSVTWSIIAVVYGGKLFNNEDIVKNIEDQIRKDYDSSTNPSRRAYVDKSTIRDDPWVGYVKTGIIFYRAKEGGPIHAAAAIDGISPCKLTNHVQLAFTGYEKPREVVKEVIKEVPKETVTEVVKEVPKEVTKEVTSGLINPEFEAVGYRLVCTVKSAPQRILASDTNPFLSFKNGVRFFLLESGPLIARDGSNNLIKQLGQTETRSGRGRLELKQDHNSMAVFSSGERLWQTDDGGHMVEELIFASEKPYLQYTKRYQGTTLQTQEWYGWNDNLTGAWLKESS